MQFDFWDICAKNYSDPMPKHGSREKFILDSYLMLQRYLYEVDEIALDELIISQTRNKAVIVGNITAISSQITGCLNEFSKGIKKYKLNEDYLNKDTSYLMEPFEKDLSSSRRQSRDACTFRDLSRDVEFLLNKLRNYSCRRNNR